MYKYMYISGEVQKGLFSSSDSCAAEDYREIIDHAARDGWRYAGNVPTKQSSYGVIKEFDLIFERESKE